jgi:hypothetical protein
VILSEQIETVDQLLEAWDSGDTIWSIEMGGMGPGYEQAIQIAAVEFARGCKDLTGIKNDDKESTDRFRKTCDEVLKKIDNDLGGITGAMYGAACYLAYNWCFTGGPDALIRRYKEKGRDERIIQVSKSLPKI